MKDVFRCSQHATYQKYLGITFLSSLKRSIFIKTLAQQANKAIIVIQDMQHFCGNIPVNVYVNLIDIENVHIQF